MPVLAHEEFTTKSKKAPWPWALFVALQTEVLQDYAGPQATAALSQTCKAFVPCMLDVCLACLCHTSPAIRCYALYGLRSVPRERYTVRVVYDVLSRLDDFDPGVRVAAARALGTLPLEYLGLDVVSCVVARLDAAEDEVMRETGLEALRHLPEAALTEAIVELVAARMGHDDMQVRAAAVTALGVMPQNVVSDDVVLLVTSLIGDPEALVREAVINVLSMFTPTRCVMIFAMQALLTQATQAQDLLTLMRQDFEDLGSMLVHKDAVCTAAMKALDSMLLPVVERGGGELITQIMDAINTWVLPERVVAAMQMLVKLPADFLRARRTRMGDNVEGMLISHLYSKRVLEILRDLPLELFSHRLWEATTELLARPEPLKNEVRSALMEVMQRMPAESATPEITAILMRVLDSFDGANIPTAISVFGNVRADSFPPTFWPSVLRLLDASNDLARIAALELVVARMPIEYINRARVRKQISRLKAMDSKELVASLKLVDKVPTKWLRDEWKVIIARIEGVQRMTSAARTAMFTTLAKLPMQATADVALNSESVEVTLTVLEGCKSQLIILGALKTLKRLRKTCLTARVWEVLVPLLSCEANDESRMLSLQILARVPRKLITSTMIDMLLQPLNSSVAIEALAALSVLKKMPMPLLSPRHWLAIVSMLSGEEFGCLQRRVDDAGRVAREMLTTMPEKCFTPAVVQALFFLFQQRDSDVIITLARILCKLRIGWGTVERRLEARRQHFIQAALRIVRAWRPFELPAAFEQALNVYTMKEGADNDVVVAMKSMKQSTMKSMKQTTQDACEAHSQAPQDLKDAGERSGEKVTNINKSLDKRGDEDGVTDSPIVQELASMKVHMTVPEELRQRLRMKIMFG